MASEPAVTKIREALVDPGSPSAEAFRTLRLALRLRSQAEDTAAVMMTSAEPRAGKSTTAANYANLSAFGGARVLVDADVRSPSQHEIFGISLAPGLVEYVAEGLPLETVVQRVSVQLDVLTAGQRVARPSDVSHSPRIRELLREAAGAYDVVIVDTPPVLATADAAGDCRG